MIILVHAAPTTLEPYRRPSLGVLSSPKRWYRDVAGWTWAADNDAFNGWDEGRWLAMLDGIEGLPGCLYVACPDVVGNAAETLRRFAHYRDEIAGRSLPVAFVAQDGLRERDPRVPWGEFSVLFVGGSTEFKLGEQAAALVREARERGVWVHVGRVNTLKRIRYIGSIEADSFDGSTFNRYRNIYLAWGLGAATAGRQERLLA